METDHFIHHKETLSGIHVTHYVRLHAYNYGTNDKGVGAIHFHMRMIRNQTK